MEWWQHQICRALLSLAYRGCPFGPFELWEKGPTNPIVEIWGRQDGPALPLRGHVTYMGLARGPSLAALRNA